MIIIYKDLVRKYINNLKKEDLIKFAAKNDITYTEEELDTVYNFIMKYYDDLLNENIRVFELLRPNTSNELYKKLLTLYIDYKQKYL